MTNLKMYIAVLDEFPDHMCPTLVAHAVLGAHIEFTAGYPAYHNLDYADWFDKSFKKVVLRVNQKEFNKIAALPDTYLAHENHTLEGRKACATS